MIADFADELRRDGVGDATVRKVLSLVQGVLGRAVVLGRIRANPVVPVRKPVQGRARAVRPLTPATVEQLRRLMPSDEDATLELHVKTVRYFKSIEKVHRELFADKI